MMAQDFQHWGDNPVPISPPRRALEDKLAEMQEAEGLSDEALTALLDDAVDEPIELPESPLGKVAELLRKIRSENMAPRPGPLGTGELPTTERQLSINDKLCLAIIAVDELRGGPDG